MGLYVAQSIQVASLTNGTFQTSLTVAAGSVVVVWALAETTGSSGFSSGPPSFTNIPGTLTSSPSGLSLSQSPAGSGIENTGYADEVGSPGSGGMTTARIGCGIIENATAGLKTITFAGCNTPSVPDGELPVRMALWVLEIASDRGKPIGLVSSNGGTINDAAHPPGTGTNALSTINYVPGGTAIRPDGIVVALAALFGDRHPMPALASPGFQKNPGPVPGTGPIVGGAGRIVPGYDSHGTGWSFDGPDVACVESYTFTNPPQSDISTDPPFDWFHDPLHFTARDVRALDSKSTYWRSFFAFSEDYPIQRILINTTITPPPIPPPIRATTFENYIFTRVVSPDAGLINVSDNRFIPCSPGQVSEGGDPGKDMVDRGISVPIPIGFDFHFDGLVYNRFCACVGGWIALVDPSTGTFASSEVMDLGGDTFLNVQNDNLLDPFTSDAVIVAPWWAPGMTNVAAEIEQLVASFWINSTKATRIRFGLEPPPLELSAAHNAVKYYNGNSPTGRYLVVRWNTLIGDTGLLPSTPGPGCRATFEVVLYENGTIEYRYAPRRPLKLMTDIGGDMESAAIGVFLSGDRWRDFSVGLGYHDDERTPYKYGGYVVNDTYTDITDNNINAGIPTRYTCNLKSSAHWPAQHGMGALFTLTPPMARRRILPRAVVRDEGSR